MCLDEFSPKLIFCVDIYDPNFFSFKDFVAFMLQTDGKVFGKVQAINFFSMISLKTILYGTNLFSIMSHYFCPILKMPKVN